MKWEGGNQKAERNIIRGSIAVIIFIVSINITLIVFGVWVVIKVLQHFGIV